MIQITSADGRAKSGQPLSASLNVMLHETVQKSAAPKSVLKRRPCFDRPACRHCERNSVVGYPTALPSQVPVLAIARALRQPRKPPIGPQKVAARFQASERSDCENGQSAHVFTRFGCQYIIVGMRQPPKNARTPAEKALDRAGIIGSLKHEGYLQTPEAEAVHERVDRGEITTDEAIEIFRQRALKLDKEISARKRRPERA
jgi:hypothetical protein